jgi:hypothetical protein
MIISVNECPMLSLLGISELEGSEQEPSVFVRYLERVLRDKGEEHVRKYRAGILDHFDFIQEMGCPTNPLTPVDVREKYPEQKLPKEPLPGQEPKLPG